MNVSESHVFEYRLPGVELCCPLCRHSHKPRRDWKKSQKKIRRERRQGMAYRKGKVRK